MPVWEGRFVPFNVVIGVSLIILAAANGILLGWLGNRGVRSWREEEHASFIDLQVLGKK